jgi:hypothetical protein
MFPEKSVFAIWQLSSLFYSAAFVLGADKGRRKRHLDVSIVEW